MGRACSMLKAGELEPLGAVFFAGRFDLVFSIGDENTLPLWQIPGLTTWFLGQKLDVNCAVQGAIFFFTIFLRNEEFGAPDAHHGRDRTKAIGKFLASHL